MTSNSASDVKRESHREAPGGGARQANAWQRWIGFLEAPVDGSSLAVFRMCFAVLMLINTWMYAIDVHLDYLKPKLFFSFIPGMQLWPGNGIYIHFAVMAIAACCVGLGVYYRAAVAVFFFAHTYLFLLEKSYYQNHIYLIALLSALLFFIPANRVWSLDNAEKPMPEWVPRWSVLLLKVQIFIVYFYGGIAKLNVDWLRGQPQTQYLLEQAGTPIIGPIVSQPWFAQLVTWGGITIDLSIGFLLFWKPTFWIGALIALAFHLMNSRLFLIGVFPYLMISTIGLFAPYDWPRRIWAKIKRTTYDSTLALASTNITGRQVALLVMLHIYVIAQVLIPLRRFLYPGETSWTEQGHRFSWSMMLRTKLVKMFSVKIIDPRTGKRIDDVDLTAGFNDKQIYYMMTRPDMILQYAHYIADAQERRLGVRPVVKVRALETLNLRPAQDLIDPRVDLTKQSDGLEPKSWIVPLLPLTPPATVGGKK